MTTPTITSDGILAARMEARSVCTNERVTVHIAINADGSLNLRGICRHFGVDLTRDQACDLGAALIHWAKTGRLEAGE